MKVRTDFVSNSSSSSFILKDIGVFEHFKIAKQDIVDAIVELYGGKKLIDHKLNEMIASHEQQLSNAMSSNEKDDWNIEYHIKQLKKLKTKGLTTFCVYDMKNEKERNECFKEWDKHFSNWYAPNEGAYEDWIRITSVLCQNCDFNNIDDVIDSDSKELEAGRYDHSTHSWTSTSFPGSRALFKYIKNRLEVKTMKDVLHEKECTLMVHFDDNEVYNLKGMADDGKDDAKYSYTPEEVEQCKASKWDSSCYTADRFFEVLIKYFIEKGKIDLSDPSFLDYWRIKDDDSWYKKSYPGKKYYLENDVATWKDVMKDCLHPNYVMHEG